MMNKINMNLLINIICTYVLHILLILLLFFFFFFQLFIIIFLFIPYGINIQLQ